MKAMEKPMYARLTPFEILNIKFAGWRDSRSGAIWAGEDGTVDSASLRAERDSLAEDIRLLLLWLEESTTETRRQVLADNNALAALDLQIKALTENLAAIRIPAVTNVTVLTAAEKSDIRARQRYKVNTITGLNITNAELFRVKAQMEDALKLIRQEISETAYAICCAEARAHKRMSVYTAAASREARKGHKLAEPQERTFSVVAQDIYNTLFHDDHLIPSGL